MRDAITKAKRSHSVQTAASEIIASAKRDKAPVAIGKVSRILASVAANAIQEERAGWLEAIDQGGEDMIEKWENVLRYAEQCKAGEVTTRAMTPEERLRYGLDTEDTMGRTKGSKNKPKLSEAEIELQEVYNKRAEEVNLVKNPPTGQYTYTGLVARGLLSDDSPMPMFEENLPKVETIAPSSIDAVVSQINTVIEDYVNRNETDTPEEQDPNDVPDWEVIEEMVDHPKHYNVGEFEVIDVIEDWGLGFNLGNAVKYIARCDFKENALQDLKKAAWYLNREISRRER